jgi:hypothetical protein
MSSGGLCYVGGPKQETTREVQFLACSHSRRAPFKIAACPYAHASNANRLESH